MPATRQQPKGHDVTRMTSGRSALALVFSMIVVGALTPAAVAVADDHGDADAVCGLWLTENGKAHVEVFSRGDRYYGKIVWLKELEYPADDPDGMAGQIKVDRKNPAEGLRARPLLGLEIVRFFKYDGEGKYKDGAIYDPENGKTYKCKMELKDAGTLDVRGFIGVSLLGRTTTWTRIAPDSTGTPPAGR